MVWRLRSTARALALIAVTLTAGILYLKIAALPAIDRASSARPLWQEIAGRRGQVCVAEIHRNWRYGLNYYSVTPLPDCATRPLPLHIIDVRRESPGAAVSPPYIRVR